MIGSTILFYTLTIKIKKMKKIIFFTAIAFLTLSSCKKENASLAKDLEFAQSKSQLNTTTSNAIPYNIQDFISLDGVTSYSPCTGEVVTWSGICHAFMQGVYNPNTNTTKENFHINFQGIKAVSSTGTQYHVQDAYHIKSTISNAGCLLTFSETLVFLLRTAGAGNDFEFSLKSSYTYNSCTNEYTVIRNERSTKCK
jgi:hypothetical protein